MPTWPRSRLRRGAHHQPLLGSEPGGGRLRRDRAGVRRDRARRRALTARRTAARAGRRGRQRRAAREHAQHPRHGEERHHRRRQRERARVRRRLVRHAERRGQQRQRRRAVLEPRPDDRRAASSPTSSLPAPTSAGSGGSDRIELRRHGHLRHEPPPAGVFFAGTAYSASSGSSHATPAVSALAAAARSSYQRRPASGRRRRWSRRCWSAARRRSAATAPASTPASTRASAWRGSPGLRRPSAGSTMSRWCSRRAARTSRARSTLRVEPTRCASRSPGPTPPDRSSAPPTSTTSTSRSAAPARCTAATRSRAGVSVPGGSADPRNNVESVIVPAGQLDALAVRVRATNIAGDGVPGGGTHRPGLRARHLQRRRPDGPRGADAD